MVPPPHVVVVVVVRNVGSGQVSEDSGGRVGLGLVVVVSSSHGVVVAGGCGGIGVHDLTAVVVHGSSAGGYLSCPPAWAVCASTRQAASKRRQLDAMVDGSCIISSRVLCSPHHGGREGAGDTRQALTCVGTRRGDIVHLPSEPDLGARALRGSSPAPSLAMQCDRPTDCHWAASRREPLRHPTAWPRAQLRSVSLHRTIDDGQLAK